MRLISQLHTNSNCKTYSNRFWIHITIREPNERSEENFLVRNRIDGKSLTTGMVNWKTRVYKIFSSRPQTDLHRQTVSGCGATRAAPWRGVSFNKNAFSPHYLHALCCAWSTWKWANISPLSVTAVVPWNFAQSYSTNVVFFSFSLKKPDPIQQRRVLLRLKQNPERKIRHKQKSISLLCLLECLEPLQLVCEKIGKKKTCLRDDDAGRHLPARQAWWRRLQADHLPRRTRILLCQ